MGEKGTWQRWKNIWIWKFSLRQKVYIYIYIYIHTLYFIVFYWNTLYLIVFIEWLINHITNTPYKLYVCVHLLYLICLNNCPLALTSSVLWLLKYLRHFFSVLGCRIHNDIENIEYSESQQPLEDPGRENLITLFDLFLVLV